MVREQLERHLRFVYAYSLLRAELTALSVLCGLQDVRCSTTHLAREARCAPPVDPPGLWRVTVTRSLPVRVRLRAITTSGRCITSQGSASAPTDIPMTKEPSRSFGNHRPCVCRRGPAPRLPPWTGAKGVPALMQSRPTACWLDAVRAFAPRTTKVSTAWLKPALRHPTQRANQAGPENRER